MQMRMGKVTVEIMRLDTPIYAGDWHDKPLRWTAQGPAGEVQNFSTRKDAERYGRIRVRAGSMADAGRKFVRGV